MSKKLLVIYIFLIIIGAILLFFSLYLLEKGTPTFGWCIGLGSAIIVLGLGFLIAYITENTETEKTKKQQLNSRSILQSNIEVKLKSGYLVCKIMNLLLCIYLIILNAMKADSTILLLSISLVLIQYFLDLILQIYYANKND